MRILLVEDEERDVEDASTIILDTIPDAEIIVARSRDGAARKLQDSDFDLIICDIRIPPSDGALDISETHGFSVHAEARELLPGVPQIFLTGHATPRNVRERLARGGTDEAFGDPDWIMVQLAMKDTPDELKDILLAIQSGVQAQHDRIALDTDGMSTSMATAIRTCGDRFGATSCAITRSAGLSAADVARAVFRDNDGKVVASVFVKVQSHSKARTEQDQFDKFVPPLLNPGVFAPSIKPVLAGVGRQAALLSTVADPESVDVFRSIVEGLHDPCSITDSIFEPLGQWRDRTSTELTTIGDLRRSVISDEYLQKIGFEIDLTIEDRAIQFEKCVIHGDLHGENVLIDSAGRPVLIDFGDTKIGVAVNDPITLELSLIFHRNGPARRCDWPSSSALKHWLNLDEFAAESPWPDFVRSCRAESERRGDPEQIAAFAYVHSIRQLKYPDTDRSVVADLSEGIADWFRS